MPGTRPGGVTPREPAARTSGHNTLEVFYDYFSEKIAERRERLGVSTADAIDSMLAEKQPSRRLSSPAEIARLAVWLCAPEAHNITGTAIPIDGGWTAQ